MPLAKIIFTGPAPDSLPIGAAKIDTAFDQIDSNTTNVASAVTTAGAAQTAAASAVTTAGTASTVAAAAATAAGAAQTTANAAAAAAATNAANITTLQGQVATLLAGLSLRIGPLSMSAVGDSITARMMGEFNTMDLNGNTTSVSQNSTFKEHGVRSWLVYGAGRSQRSWFPWEYVAGGSGFTLSQVISTSLPALLTYPGGFKPDMCAVLAGTNDVGALTALSVTLPLYKTILSTLLSAGILPIVCAIPPQTSTTAGAVAQFNAGLARLAAELDLQFADMWTPLANPSTGVWVNANYTSDNTHPSPAGCMLMGAALNEAVQSICKSKKLWWGQHDLGAGQTTNWSRDPNLTSITGTINTASSYSSLWSAPGTTAMSTMFNSAGTEPGTGSTIWPGPLAIAVGGMGPNVQGNSWMLAGDGTHSVNSSLTSTLTGAVGDRIALMFRMKAIPDLAATVGMGFRMVATSGGGSNKIMGLGWAAQSITPVTGAILAPIGSDTTFPAYDFYFEMVLQTAQAGAIGMQFQLGTLNGFSTSNANDRLIIANPRLVNLTAAGIDAP